MAAPDAAPPRPQPRPMVTSAAGAAALKQLYDETLAALPLPHECRWVHTSFGRTHVLVVGPANAPPVIVFHGTACPAPFMLAGMGPELPQRCRVYIPDIPGQAGSRSDPALLDPSQHGHGTWAAEVVAALGLTGSDGAPAPLGIGTSLGAAVLLDLAVTCPGAVRGAALIAPVCLYPGGRTVGDAVGGAMTAASHVRGCSARPDPDTGAKRLARLLLLAAVPVAQRMPCLQSLAHARPPPNRRHRRRQVDAAARGAGVCLVPPAAVPRDRAVCAVQNCGRGRD